MIAALRQVDRTGEFTIAQVADALGVRPSSLYNHLGSKAEIVEGMRLHVFREGDFDTEDTEDTETWDQTVRNLCAATASVSRDIRASSHS